MGDKKENLFEGEFKEFDFRKFAEPLSQNNYKLAEPLIPCLGEEFCQKLFSMTWQFREECLRWLTIELRHPKHIKADDLGVLFVSVMGAVNFT